MPTTSHSQVAEFLNRCQTASEEQREALLQEASALLQQTMQHGTSFKTLDAPLDLEELEKTFRGIGHNINGIFATIRGMVEITQLKEPNLSPAVDDALKKIDTMIERGEHTTEQTRLYGKVLRVNKTSQPLNVMFRRISNDCRMSFDFPIEYHSQLTDEEGELDLFQMEHLIPQLVKNSLDAIEIAAPETPEIIIETRISGEHQNMLELKISDNGCGIPEENVDKIFIPFFSTKPAHKGIGMGMAIVKQIVHNHDGNIHCETNSEGNTVVRISLPLSQSA